MPVGGARPGAGRPKGSPNKANQDLRRLAQQYTNEALQALVDIVRNETNPNARVQAAAHLLDRGFGKPGQHLEVDAEVKQDVLVTAINLVGPKT